MQMNRSRVNYGLDAPGVVRAFLSAGGACLALAVLCMLLPIPVARGFVAPLSSAGISMMLSGLVMVRGSKFGKLRLRDRALSRLSWRGDEQVLDVGCGHGLMLIGAAKRLSAGKATGVDLWKVEDQAGNRRDATQRNVELERVADRVELKDGDARQLPFERGQFDVVVSSWALHNIYEQAGRRKALEEIVRVLKPGGQLLLVDIRHAGEYADVLRTQGMQDVELSGPSFIFVIPTRCVQARKPATQA